MWEASSLNTVITQGKKRVWTVNTERYSKNLCFYLPTQAEPLSQQGWRLPYRMEGHCFYRRNRPPPGRVCSQAQPFSPTEVLKSHVHRLFSCKMGSGTIPEHNPAFTVGKHIAKSLCLHAVPSLFLTSITKTFSGWFWNGTGTISIYPPHAKELPNSFKYFWDWGNKSYWHRPE